MLNSEFNKREAKRHRRTQEEFLIDLTVALSLVAILLVLYICS